MIPAKVFYVVLSLVILTIPAFLFAAPDSIQTRIYRIVLSDESTLIGIISSEDDSTIQFKTLSGLEVTIPLDLIEKKQRLAQKLWREKSGVPIPTRPGFFSHQPGGL